MPPQRVDVGLQHIDRAGFQHAAGIVERVDVFAGGDIHRRRRPLAREPQARQIVRRDRLLEPADIGLAASLANRSACLNREGPVGVDEQLTFADRRPWRPSTRCGSRAGSLPIFILTKRQPSRSTQPESWSRSSSSE